MATTLGKRFPVYGCLSLKSSLTSSCGDAGARHIHTAGHNDRHFQHQTESQWHEGSALGSATYEAERVCLGRCAATTTNY
mmetsp:Transcript_17365/g.47912  ORF Transcript_17365/g.47912 Transcript_17365/m.47912 type:complete len:80 (+) Transcript_17365:1770-2009(+)